MPFPESASSTVYLDPGPHTVVASWSNNRHRNSDVNAIPGGNSKLVFNAAAADKPASADTPLGSQNPANGTGDMPVDRGPEGERKGGLPPLVFFIGLGATAVLGGVTTWSGIDTLEQPGTVDEVKQICSRRAKTLVCVDLKAEGAANETRTNVLLGVTGVVGITTGIIALFFTNWGDDPAPPEKKDARIMPVVGVNNGVTIGAVGRF